MTAGPAPAGAPTDGDTPTASFAQRRLWFLDQLAGRSTGSTLPLVLRLRGSLDAARLERALSGIVERHEVLRTRFTAAGGEPVPVVDAPAGIVLERTEADGPDDLFARYLGRPVDLSAQHPVRATLARVAPDEHLLLVEVHHIAVDGWSWGVLLTNSPPDTAASPSPRPPCGTPTSPAPRPYGCPGTGWSGCSATGGTASPV
ncbi:condensation domain-containing protein [Streptomyces diastatochromogenes]|nr:condensation domain-containing protein [Streptomyces diastatochromogenes]